MSADIRNGRILVRMSHRYQDWFTGIYLGVELVHPRISKIHQDTNEDFGHQIHYKIHITQSYVKILDSTQQVGGMTGQKKTYSIYMYYCCFKSSKYWLRSEIS